MASQLRDYAARDEPRRPIQVADLELHLPSSSSEVIVPDRLVQQIVDALTHCQTNRDASYDAIDLALGRLAKKIDASSVPVIVEMPSLDDTGGQIRVEQPDAFAC
jgi:hypothetical protein